MSVKFEFSCTVAICSYVYIIIPKHMAHKHFNFDLICKTSIVLNNLSSLPDEVGFVLLHAAKNNIVKLPPYNSNSENSKYRFIQ